MQPAIDASGATIATPRRPDRLLSLDFFRGLTVAGMTLVNNPGDWGHIYAPLEHAPWNGWTPTDLVFPFFLFIVGVSITFALDTARLTPDRHGDAIRKIVRRSLTLFGLGLFLNLFPSFNFATVRIMGVLQRIGLVYLFTSLIFLKTTPKQQGWIMAGLLIGYWLLMTVVPVPGVGAANLEPASNLSAWLDRVILGVHNYKPTRVWDPEGLLSTIPAIGTGLFGVLTGIWLRSNRPAGERMAWLFTAGVLTMLVAHVWDAFFPINKQLWTSSYVLLAAGLAMLGLATCYWLIDVQDRKRGTGIFVAFGVNAITVFFLSGLIPRIMNLIHVTRPDGTDVGLKQWLYESFIVPLFTSPLNASLAGALTFVLIWAAIAGWMYRKNIIVKV